MFLGLDLGTSGLKALLVDDAENIIAESVAPLQVSRPHDGWVEQDPRDWFTACADAIAGLGVDLAAVQGIGLSGTSVEAITITSRARLDPAPSPSHRRAPTVQEPGGAQGLGANS